MSNPLPGTGGLPPGTLPPGTIPGPGELPTYALTYDANGADEGAAPEGGSHAEGAQVVVLGNSGALDLEDYDWSGWNTAANGSGTTYLQGQTIEMPGGALTLYARWLPTPAPIAKGARAQSASMMIPTVLTAG